MWASAWLLYWGWKYQRTTSLREANALMHAGATHALRFLGKAVSDGCDPVLTITVRFPPFCGDMLYKEELCPDCEEILIGSSVMGLCGS